MGGRWKYWEYYRLKNGELILRGFPSDVPDDLKEDMDGDVLKDLVGSGYSEKERMISAKKYCAICKMPVDQGITVIICTVAMFEEVRRWNRKPIEKYVEIFLVVPLEILQKRDKKGLYSICLYHLTSSGKVSKIEV
ncbi:MAG: adenylyl-sulfate kinase [Lachnospiraceae bacterium]|nr:adenylyl-sulfate kinase [Lachnospiraceae bacterium]